MSDKAPDSNELEATRTSAEADLAVLRRADSASSSAADVSAKPARSAWYLLQHRALRPVAAVLFVAAGVAVRLVCLENLGGRAAFVTLYPAVVLSALCGGLTAGLLATALSGLSAAYFWLNPVGFRISDPADWLSVIIFLANGILISFVTEGMHRARARAYEAEARNQIAIERHKDEEQLRLQAAALQAAANAIVITGLNGSIQWVNAAFTRLTGYGAAEAIGKNPRVLKSGKHPPAFYKSIWDAVLAGNVWQGTVINRRKDGQLYTEEMTITPVRNSTGSITHFVAIKQDVTQRQNAEEALRQSEAQLQTVVENLTEGLLVFDLNSKMLLSNQVALRMHGFSSSEKVTRTSDFVERFDVSTLDGVALTADQRPLQRIIRGEHLRDVELRVRRRDANWERIFDFNGRLVHDTAGKPLLAIVTVNDITERKTAEEERALLAAIVESSNDAIFSVTLEGDILSWNAGAERMFGYHSDEIIGQSILRLQPSELQTQEIRVLERLKRGERIRTYETTRLSKEGRQIEVSLTVSPLVDGHGKLIGASKIIHDITSRKRSEAALRQTAQDLVRSNHDLEQFAYVASHDLQEPLRAVSGYVQLLQQRFPEHVDEKARQYITGAVEGAARMQGLIHDLLAFSRVGSTGKTFLPADLNSALADALGNLRVSIKETNAKITSEPLPTVRADATQMTQLFQNLIANAVKFRRDQNPEIHVSARREPHQWQISVRDNGIGIEPQYFDRIFQIFQRLHTRKQYPGTGIGLAICKRIVERHGGAINLESSPDWGSTFHFTIPITPLDSAHDVVLPKSTPELNEH